MALLLPLVKRAGRPACVRYAILGLMNVVFRFHLPRQEGFFVLQLLSSSRPRPSGYTGTRVQLAFNSQLAQYLLNVARLDDLPAPEPT